MKQQFSKLALNNEDVDVQIRIQVLEEQETEEQAPAFNEQFYTDRINLLTQNITDLKKVNQVMSFKMQDIETRYQNNEQIVSYYNSLCKFV